MGERNRQEQSEIKMGFAYDRERKGLVTWPKKSIDYKWEVKLGKKENVSHWERTGDVLVGAT